ncbi:MAG TPA: hypothetical protein VIK27_04295, partial [Candidatus Aquilonibacter sp.]
TTMRSILPTASFATLSLHFFHPMYDGFELIEPLFPQLAIAQRPLGHRFERLRPQHANALTSALDFFDDLRANEISDMLGNHLLREIERLGELMNGRRTTGEPVNHRPSRFIRQSGEGNV